MANNERTALVQTGHVESVIISLRGQRVLLDRDLAALYEVETGMLNRAVQRNLERFPDDFMFPLTTLETRELAEAEPRLKNLKFARRPPHAFSEHGAIMAASVLSSPRAVEASVLVVRAFVKVRQLLASHKELAQKVSELERKLGDHDEAIQAIFSAIKQLMEPPPQPPKQKIGFRS